MTALISRSGLAAVLLVAVIDIAAPGVSVAQQSLDSVKIAARASVAEAIRVQKKSPRIDGILDDEIWAVAPVITNFIQRDPDQGKPGSERTEAQIVYDDNAIYVAIRAFDSEPEKIAAHLTRRDGGSPSDWVGVMIDSYRDRRTAFEFIVNPLGVKRDVYRYNDNSQDGSWNAVWDVKTSRDSRGWTAEFRIPYSQLRFSRSPENIFGFNVWRSINRKSETQYWKLLPKDQSGVVSLFGDLVGINGITPPRRLEVQPYTVGTLSTEPAEAGNPFQDGRQGSFTTGADIKYGVTSSLTLSATVNPDFGQVEADPAVVNLSAFETFFPEKRPFFNEGLDIFQFSLGSGDGNVEQLFYTRRVGRAPQGFANPRGGFSERVNQTTILGAAKLSGKTQTGWTIGLTGALTARENAHSIDSIGVRRSDPVEPRSGYMVGRLAKDFRNGLTQIGVIGTATTRALPNELDFLRSSAYTFGFDWTHRFKNDAYKFSGKVIGSRVNGSQRAIGLTQLSSARYFQRPDANYVTFDPTRTSLSGGAAVVSFMKQTGNWRGGAGYETRSPGFELNDLGFQQNADFHSQWLWLNRRWLEPGKIFRRFNINFNQWSTFNYGGDRLNLGGNVNVNFTTSGYWNGFFGMNRNQGGLATDQLRGGPGIQRPGAWNGWAGFSSDFRKTFRYGSNGWYFKQDETGSWGGGVGFFTSVRPASNLDFRVSPNLSKSHDTWQYLRTTTALGSPEYIFGELDQTTVSMQFRGNMTFTPDLSLQVYAEPFVSAGNYQNYQRVNDPRGAAWSDRMQSFAGDQVAIDSDGNVSVDLDRNGTPDVNLGNPNFTFLSFRSNVVLRWEYKLGSTIFFVWQHNRSGFSNNGKFRFGSDFSDLLGADARNNFVIKINYWMNM